MRGEAFESECIKIGLRIEALQAKLKRNKPNEDAAADSLNNAKQELTHAIREYQEKP